MTRPNIVYFHSHDTGRYVEPYGYAVSTPNYQKLAEAGLLFRQAFTAAPTCSPSRAALLTGQSPHAAGMIGLAHRGFRLNDPEQHLAWTLQREGYNTLLAGVQHVTTGDPAECGYLEVADRTSSDTAHITQNAVDMLANTPQPFFLDVGFADTHRAYPEATTEDARYVRPPAPIPDTPETRLDTARYMKSLNRLDNALGAILERLDQLALTESTLVICTTDHGLALPFMKCNLTDHGTGVLLILRGPGVPARQVSEALVSQIDIYPTLCDLLHIEPPAWLTGTSLMPVIRGDVDEVNDAVFAEVTYHAAYEPQRAVRTRDWTYIRRFEDRKHPVLPNCDDGESRDVLLAAGWDSETIASEQLYNNLLDPMQRHNRVPDRPEVLTEMRSRLQQWMEATADPLLQGPVPLPSGARVNDPDSRAFSEPLIEAREDGSLQTIANPNVNA